jgi:hypothetical protein
VPHAVRIQVTVFDMSERVRNAHVTRDRIWLILRSILVPGYPVPTCASGYVGRMEPLPTKWVSVIPVETPLQTRYSCKNPLILALSRKSSFTRALENWTPSE